MHSFFCSGPCQFLSTKMMRKYQEVYVTSDYTPYIMEVCEEVQPPGDEFIEPDSEPHASEIRFDNCHTGDGSLVILNSGLDSVEELVEEEPVLEETSILTLNIAGHVQQSAGSLHDDNQECIPVTISGTVTNNEKYNGECFLTVSEVSENHQQTIGEEMLSRVIKSEVGCDNDDSVVIEGVQQSIKDEMFQVSQVGNDDVSLSEGELLSSDSLHHSLPVLEEDCVEIWPEVGQMLEVSCESPADNGSSSEDTLNGLQTYLISADSSILTSSYNEQTPPVCMIIDGKPYNILMTENGGDSTGTVETEDVSRQGLILSDSANLASTVSRSKKSSVPKSWSRRLHRCKEDGCNKTYSSLHHLKVHTRSHRGIRPHRCPVEGCEKAFSTMYSCMIHVRIHTGEKPYQCVHCQCTKAFKTSSDLQRHMRTHTGERPFRCPIEGCSKAFTTANIRKIHVRTHTGEKPFVCDVEGCERKFSSSTNYKNHMRIHSGEKPYACPVEGCMSRFTEYSSLYKHGKVHKQNSVMLCGSIESGTKLSSRFPLKKSSGMPTIRTRRNPRKKHEKVVSYAGGSLSSLQDDEPEDLDHHDTLNLSLGNDDFEVYQLILSDDFPECV